MKARALQPGAMTGLAACILVAGGCASAPTNVADVCDVFDEKGGWYRHARKAEKKWNISIPVMMAVANRESSFESRARPPRKKILGIIPGRRPSSAYGFAQATDETWDDYKRATGRKRASRKRFSDAVDFIGWYLDRSHRELGIARTDAYRLYLSYHEGLGGYRRGTWKSKAWLREAAGKVAADAQRYADQLATCRRFLGRGLMRIFG